MKYSVREIAKFVAGTPAGNGEISCHGVSTDTRSLTRGNLFVALRGETFDGNDFVGEARKRGAVAAIVERAPIGHEFPLILVKNSLQALQTLAAHHRSRFNPHVVGITGSNGKTTTKSLLHHLLQQRHPVLASRGNLNNHIGLPLNLLKLEGQHQFAIFEMGMNNFGEIEKLKELAKPQTAMITNIGYSHLEKLGSLAGVARGKKELLTEPHPPITCLLPRDDPFFEFLATGIKGQILTFGEHPHAHCRLVSTEATKGGTRATIAYGPRSITAKTPYIGKFWLTNFLAPVLFAMEHGIPDDAIIRAIETFEPVEMRGQVIEFTTTRLGKPLRVIKDFYNANPSSVLHSAEALDHHSGAKIMVLGDMKELGAMSDECHREVGKSLANHSIDLLLTFGEAARRAGDAFNRRRARSGGAIHCATISELWQTLWQHLLGLEECTLLIKGSRAMKLERLFEIIEEQLKKADN